MLQAILTELPLESGAVSVNGKISYAAQEPWIFASTARQNILFGQEMDHRRYDDVVKVCALVKDFEQFEFGDKTIIGEKGKTNTCCYFVRGVRRDTLPSDFDKNDMILRLRSRKRIGFLCSFTPLVPFFKHFHAAPIEIIWSAHISSHNL